MSYGGKLSDSQKSGWFPDAGDYGNITVTSTGDFTLTGVCGTTNVTTPHGALLLDGTGVLLCWDAALNAWKILTAPAKPAAEPVCECGVKFTGGAHSDWCPRSELNAP